MKLPAEPDLCAEFGVSRATIREAVRSLAEAGYLSRVHGSGTYVVFRSRVRHTLERNLSYSTLIKHAGYEPGLRLLSLERDHLNATEAEAFQLHDVPVVRIRRVRSANERPVIYSIDAILGDFVSEVCDEDFAGSLYKLFDKIGCSVANGEAALAPVLTDSGLASELQVEVGSPLLRILQVDYTSSGQAIMFSQEWHVPDVLELTLRRRAT